MRAAFLLVVCAVALLGCGGSDELVPIDAPDQVDPDAGVDAAPGSLTACLDRPTDLPRPPAGQLPCELVPPGLTITP